MIKVLFVYRDYFSRNRGTPLRIKSLIKEVLKDDELSVYTASRDEENIFKSPHLCLSTQNLKNIYLIHQFIKKNEIDVVAFHTISGGYYLLPLWLLGGRYKRVLEMHGFFEEEAVLYNDITFFKYYRNKFFYSLIYRMSHLITTCSETATSTLRKYNKNTHTIFGGVDLHLFSKALNFELKKDINSEIILGYAGNGRKWQGLEFLLKAFAELNNKDDSFTLRLLLSEKFNLPKTKNVLIYPALYHEEVWRFNAECDVLIIPRPNNTVNKLSFPSKLMEYLASGKPVIASKTSDVHKIITHKESGMLYDPDDIQGFIECCEALKDPAVRKKIAINGYNLAKNGYTWEIQGKKFANLLKNSL